MGARHLSAGEERRSLSQVRASGDRLAFGEVARTRAPLHAAAGHAQRDAPEAAIEVRIRRLVAQTVLMRQFIGNVAVHAGELVELHREKRARASLECQLAQLEV